VPAEAPAKKARVFFALWPSPAAAARLGAIAGTVAAASGGRPTRVESIHLTLAFVGDVAEDRLPGLTAAADAVRGVAFSLGLDRLGYWANNRLCWAGCSAVPAALASLASDLRAALRDAGFAVEHGRAGFVPHVTLVRKMAHGMADQPIEPIVAWHCPAFVLVRSRLSPTGSRYERLHEFPLAR
jgi:2'-5' RNA ligase